MNPKPGYQTSEFWLSLLAIIAGSLVANGGLAGAPSWVGAVVGGVSVVLTALGYNAGRAQVKAATAAPQWPEAKRLAELLHAQGIGDDQMGKTLP